MSGVKRGFFFVDIILARCKYAPRIILDLCPGSETFELAARLPQSLVVGLIPPDERKRIAALHSDWMEKRGVCNVNLLLGRHNDLPFEDGTFDLALYNGTLLEFSPDREQCKKILSEIYRVLSIEGEAFLYFLLDQPSLSQKNKDASHIEINAEEIIGQLGEMVFIEEIQIARKELNLEVAFKRIR